MAGARIDVFRRTSHNNPVTGGTETEVQVLRRDADALTGRLGLVYQPLSTLGSVWIGGQFVPAVDSGSA
jgi:hypothetical protein